MSADIYDLPSSPFSMSHHSFLPVYCLPYPHHTLFFFLFFLLVFFFFFDVFAIASPLLLPSPPFPPSPSLSLSLFFLRLPQTYCPPRFSPSNLHQLVTYPFYRCKALALFLVSIFTLSFIPPFHSLSFFYSFPVCKRPSSLLVMIMYDE